MYAQVTTIFSPPDNLAAGIARAEGPDRVAVQASRGNQGLTTLVDSDLGVIVAISYWDNLIHSSAPSLTRARERVAAAAEGDLIIETYTIAWQEPGSTRPRPGATVRIDRLQIDRSIAVTEQELLRTQLIQETQFDREFCGSELMIDPGRGAALLITTWTSVAAATRADAVLTQSADARTRPSIAFHPTEHYALVHDGAPI